MHLDIDRNRHTTFIVYFEAQRKNRSLTKVPIKLRKNKSQYKCTGFSLTMNRFERFVLIYKTDLPIFDVVHGTDYLDCSTILHFL